MNIKKHLNLLGHVVKDRVTGFGGTIDSISFDLYGCVQAAVNPGMDKDGKLGRTGWFDVSRLDVLTTKPVMPPPNFDFGPSAAGKHGPADKPIR